MQVVNITIELKDAQQSHDLEKYLRFHMLPEYKIDFVNLRNTKQLYEDDKHFRKLVKGVKDAKKVRDNYIHKNN